METQLSILLKEKGSTVYTVKPKESVFDCAKKMNELNVGALLVMEDEEVKGLVSERDIIRKLISCNCEVGKYKVSDIMSSDLMTVTRSTKVGEAMAIMTNKRYRHLPVIDEGKLVGIISIGDLTKHLMLEQQKEISSLSSYIRGDHTQTPPQDK